MSSDDSDLEEPQTLSMVDPVIFEQMQAKIDEDAQVREVGLPTNSTTITAADINTKELKAILQTLERQGTKAPIYVDAVTELSKAELLSPSFPELIRPLRPEVGLILPSIRVPYV